MKPILFNTDMVRAILDGRKTVTRRPMKPQPCPEEYGPHVDCDGFFNFFLGKTTVVGPYKPPYQPGDILYVRETWAVNNITPHDPEYIYKSDYDCTIKPYSNWKWRPSIHMPKDAARIFLRVTDVRVERLQDITEREIFQDTGEVECTEYNNVVPYSERFKYLLRAMWGRYWDKHIVKMDECFCWDANPWVWVIEFERISKEEAMKNETD